MSSPLVDPPRPRLREKAAEEASREARQERDRCISLVWENRGKCASNAAALALMNLLNGNT